jgi:hypothetical protein
VSDDDVARVVPEPPRFLHKRSHHGYTDRLDLAMHAEPEAVPREDQALITARVHRTEREAQVLHWSERRARVEREIDWLYSQRFQRDISKPLRTLRRQLDRIDKQITGRTDAVSYTTKARQGRLPRPRCLGATSARVGGGGRTARRFRQRRGGTGGKKPRNQTPSL